jgi:hypothetical protein
VITYRAMLDVPHELVGSVSKLLYAERRTRGTRTGTRALTCWNQALFVLVWFRKREDLTVPGAGFGISRATTYRYRDEGLQVLAAQAPDLHQAQATACGPPSSSQPTADRWTPTTAPTTPCRARCAASGNAASRY